MQQYQDLIERCIAGESKSQRELYDLLKGRLMGICIRYNRAQEDAHDVFQEAMIRLFKNIEQAARVDSFEAWVRRITTNAAIDAYKKRKAHLHVSMDNEQVPDFADAEVNAFERLNAEEIIDLLHEIPDNQRIVFNLFVIDGYSHKEIAVKLEIAESTSRVLLTRSKRSMIELLKKTETHEQRYG